MMRVSSWSRMLAITILAGVPGSLATPSSAWASCVLEPPRIKADVLDQYEDNPKGMLLAFNRGGFGMEAAIRQLAVRGPEALSKIFLMARDGLPVQKLAIGRGLRTAADVCLSQDAGVALAINQAVSRADIRDVTHAFNAGANMPPPATALNSSAWVNAASPALPDQLRSTLGASASQSDNRLADPFGELSGWH